MNKCYVIYKYKVLTNFEIPFLSENEVSIYSDYDAEIILCYGGYEKGNLIAFSGDNFYNISSPYAEYKIDAEKCIIHGYSENINQIVSTLFNIPFSILSLTKGDVLLHGSSIEYKGAVYCFVGDKGAGKSTLTAHLMKRFNFYSDDTILISTPRLTAYRSGANILKLNSDSYDSSRCPTDKPFDMYTKNSQGKACIEIKRKFSENTTFYTKKIYIIERKNHEIPAIIPMRSFLSRKYALLNNVVGSAVIPGPFKSQILKNSVFKALEENITISRLIIPNNLNSLTEISDMLEKDINHESIQ